MASRGLLNNDILKRLSSNCKQYICPRLMEVEISIDMLPIIYNHHNNKARGLSNKIVFKNNTKI